MDISRVDILAVYIVGVDILGIGITEPTHYIIAKVHDMYSRFVWMGRCCYVYSQNVYTGYACIFIANFCYDEVISKFRFVIYVHTLSHFTFGRLYEEFDQRYMH